MIASKTDSVKFLIRLPVGLRDQLKAAAQQNGRSMNSEILDRINKHVGFTEIEQKVEALRIRVERMEGDKR